MIAIESPTGSTGSFSLQPINAVTIIRGAAAVTIPVTVARTNYADTISVGINCAAVANFLCAGSSIASPTTAGQLTLSATNSAASGTYTVTVTATGPGALASQTTLTVILQDAPASSGFSLQLNSQSAQRFNDFAGQSLAYAKVQDLTAWRVDLRVHDFAATTVPTVLTAVWPSFQYPQLRMDPATQTIGISDSWWGVLASNCSVSYAGRTDILLRMQLQVSTGQYSFQLWNADGSSFVTATGAGCLGGTWGNAESLSRIALGGSAYGTELLKGSIAYWRFYGVHGAGQSDPPASTPALNVLLDYEFDQQTLTDTSLISPGLEVTLYPSGTPSFIPTPAVSGGSVFALYAGAQTPTPVISGGSATFPITIVRANFSGSVGFTCTSLVAGVTCSAPASTTNSTTLTVTTTAATPASTAHTLTLSTTGAGVPAASLALANFNVIAPAASISLTVPTTPATVTAGSSTNTGFVINSIGFAGSVTVTCSSTFNPTCIATPANPIAVVPGSRSVSLQINVPAGTSPGTYLLSIGATGANVAATPVSTTVTVVACGLENYDTTQLPLNGGASIRLRMSCDPASGPTDPYADAGIAWQLLDSSAQPVSGNTGAPTTFASVRQFTVPVNSGNTVVTYYARATYNSSAVRTATFQILVNPVAGVQIYPESSPGPSGRYEVNPGGSFTLGVQVFGPGTAPCAVYPAGSPGVLVDITPVPSAFTKVYRYDAPLTTTSQLNLLISCISNLVSTVRDSLPIQVTNALSLPPTITSITSDGPGFTNGFFSNSHIYGTFASSGNPIQSGTLLINPSDRNFTEANACKAQATPNYGSNPPTAMWTLWDDAGTSTSTPTGTFSWSPYYPTIQFRYNNQCKLENQGAKFQSAIGFTGGTIHIQYALSYQSSYLGTHKVWGKLILTSGLESAWTLGPNLLTVQ